MVSADLIVETLCQLSLNRTPGPDGLTAEFYRTVCGFLDSEISDVIKSFFFNSFMPSALNSTSLVLIFKRHRSVDIKEFHPISCRNTLYKLILRILADRLKPILPEIIPLKQTAFVKERLLLENVLLASEVLQGYHNLGLTSSNHAEYIYF